ncbi:maker501 [Drosophila busckii]|nr:maker501 [Drosophila busckii]
MKLLVLAFLATLALSQALVKEEIAAKEYLENLNKELALRTNVDTEAAWAYASNINDENEKKRNENAAELAKFLKEIAADTQKFNWRSYQSEDIKRQFKFLTKLGYAAL